MFSIYVSHICHNLKHFNISFSKNNFKEEKICKKNIDIISSLKND